MICQCGCGRTLHTFDSVREWPRVPLDQMSGPGPLHPLDQAGPTGTASFNAQNEVARLSAKVEELEARLTRLYELSGFD